MMTRQKIFIVGGGIAALLIVVGWFLLARYLIGGGDISDLQNNILIEQAQNDLSDTDIDSTNSQDVSIKDELIKSDADNENFAGDLYMVIPHWVDQQALQDLTDRINTDSSTVTLHITQATNHIEYADILADEDQMESFDLVLLSSSRYDSYHDQILKFPFQQNIISGFHPSLSDIILESDFSFLPYAIDPLVTYADSQIADADFGRDDVVSYLIDQPDLDQIPLGLGISAVDTKLLATDRHPLPGYRHTLSQIVASSMATTDHTLLSQLIGASLRDFRSIFKAADTQNPLCDTDIALCLYMAGQLQVGFGSLSSFLYADKQVKKTQKYISSLPDMSSLTADARGWVAPTTATHRESILARLVGYLQQAPSSNLPLRDTSLSVFPEVSHLQLLQTQYTDLTPYIKNNKLTILQGTQDDFDTLLDGPLMSVLEGDYSAGLYIDEYGGE